MNEFVEKLNEALEGGVFLGGKAVGVQLVALVAGAFCAYLLAFGLTGWASGVVGSPGFVSIRIHFHIEPKAPSQQLHALLVRLHC